LIKITKSKIAAKSICATNPESVAGSKDAAGKGEAYKKNDPRTGRGKERERGAAREREREKLGAARVKFRGFGTPTT